MHRRAPDQRQNTFIIESFLQNPIGIGQKSCLLLSPASAAMPLEEMLPESLELSFHQTVGWKVQHLLNNEFTFPWEGMPSQRFFFSFLISVHFFQWLYTKNTNYEGEMSRHFFPKHHTVITLEAMSKNTKFGFNNHSYGLCLYNANVIG